MKYFFHSERGSSMHVNSAAENHSFALMMVLDNVMIATLLLILNVFVLIQLNERRRRYWVHPMNQSRDDTSVRIRVDALQAYPETFFSYFPMQQDTFRYVLNTVRQRIERMRGSIDPETRLGYSALPLIWIISRYSYALRSWQIYCQQNHI